MSCGINRRVAKKILKYIYPLQLTTDIDCYEIPIFVNNHWKILIAEALDESDFKYGKGINNYFYVSEIDPLTGNARDLSITDLTDLCIDYMS
jgi:hypothetical protein